MTLFANHRDITVIALWGLFALIILLRWYRSHGKKAKPRHMSALSLVTLNMVFLFASVHFIYLHKVHMFFTIACWIVAFLVSTVLILLKSLSLEIKRDPKTDLFEVPGILYRIVFYVYVPYLLFYFTLLTYNLNLLNNIFFVAIVMFFKGIVSGIYLGFSLATFWKYAVD